MKFTLNTQMSNPAMNCSKSFKNLKEVCFRKVTTGHKETWAASSTEETRAASLTLVPNKGFLKHTVYSFPGTLTRAIHNPPEIIGPQWSLVASRIRWRPIRSRITKEPRYLRIHLKEKSRPYPPTEERGRYDDERDHSLSLSSAREYMLP